MLFICSSIDWNDLDGELALFDPRDGRYHALNSPAAAIWRGIADGLSPAMIVARLADLYAAPPDHIAADVAAFIDQALAKGLIERRGDAG